MQLSGFHHVTAVTAKIDQNHAFYTAGLGLRLVKKTVNQDDVSAYHLFYADGRGSPGTDMTFFDWPVPRERRGTHSVIRTGFRVPSRASVQWWLERFTAIGIQHSPVVERDGRLTLEFEDAEGQRLAFVEDASAPGPFTPWPAGGIPTEHQIRGLGPVTLSVPRLAPTARTLTSVMGMREERTYTDALGASVHVFAMGQGGPSAELHVAVHPSMPFARQGAGSVHHVAFRTTAAEYGAWVEQLKELGVSSSGPVNRFYFQSLYFREPNGILFEIATDEPGFSADEPEATMGTRLALPPFLEPRRAEIEAGLKPLS
jgi:glyoxalase family protein